MPNVNSNPSLQKYYTSLESRIGYWLFLGGTRHFGYYEDSTSNPFPIDNALRAMEKRLLHALQCSPGSTVLDAGCGVGHVALYMAREGGLLVKGIDVMDYHLAKASGNILRAGMGNMVSAQLGDYHNLEDIDDRSFDGVYTMETFVHATNPLKALREFQRVLMPGGRLALFEYDHVDMTKAPKDLAESMAKANEYAAMPANASFDRDVLQELLLEAGFEDVRLEDLSAHIVPMLWLFYIFALVPCFFIQLIGLEHRFVNTLVAVEAYRGRHLWRYIQVTGTKPI